MDNKKTCLVNFASNSYTKYQSDLKNSFIKAGFKGDFLFWNFEKDLKCPPHKEVPYAFKSYAFQEAIKKGYEYILWADSPIKVIGDLNKAFDRLKEYGYLLGTGGWNTGQWCSDDCMNAFGLIREELFKMPHLTACVMGFDYTNDLSKEFLRQLHFRAVEQITFKGAWKNLNKEVSDCPDVLGHRHDQTVASIIAQNLGMTYWQPFVTYDENYKPDNIIFLNKR